MNIAEEKLYELSKLFDKPLYLVGGAVRNTLLGLPAGDYDTASANLPEEITERIKGTEFSALAVYPRTGTVLIGGSDGFTTEHTTFRKDSYPLNSGAHTPETVEFTADIKIDALRRDFSVNAIYFNLKLGDISDPTGGLADLKARILRAVDTPERVLGEDALRILRLVRQSAELGFDIESNTLKAASALGNRVKDVSRERITDEYIRILKASEKYGVKSVSISDSLKLLVKLNCFDIVTGIDCVGKAAPYLDGSMELDTILSGIYYRETNIPELLKALKFSNDIIKGVTEGVAALNASDITLPDFIAEHYSGYKIVKELIDPTKRLLIDSLAAGGVPMTIGELKINGRDALSLGVTGKRVGYALKRVLIDSISRLLRTRDEQLESLRAIIEGENNGYN